MSFHKQLVNLLPVIYPIFCTVKDPAGNEFVRLDEGSIPQDPENVVRDRTQYEAVWNHVHLAEGRIKNNREQLKIWGTAVAENLVKTLRETYPEKRFLVFLTINNEGMILRFHQKWKGEPPYYDLSRKYEDDSEIFVFDSDCSEGTDCHAAAGGSQ